jgi:hypothetical protein
MGMTDKSEDFMALTEDEIRNAAHVYLAGQDYAYQSGFRSGFKAGKQALSSWWFPFTVLVSGVAGAVIALAGPRFL